MPADELAPFYERLIRPIPGRLIGPAVVSLGLGFAVLIALGLAAGHRILLDGAWVLALLISTAMLFLYLATYILRALMAEIDVRLRYAGEGDASRELMDRLTSTLSDRNFVLAGLFFGLLNAYLGYKFGLPYCETKAQCQLPAVFKDAQTLTLLAGYFLAGFVCGMPVLGIVGVCLVINRFAAKAKTTFDLASPDGCAGTSFIGEALTVFAAVTLIVGIMISIYIVRTPWTEPHEWWVDVVKRFWIAFPYLMSLTVLIIPSLPIARELREHKFEREVALKERLADIRKRLDDAQKDAPEQKDLREQRQAVQKEWNELYQIRTWPFGLDVNFKYLGTLAGGSIVHLLGTLKGIPSWIMKLIS